VYLVGLAVILGIQHRISPLGIVHHAQNVVPPEWIAATNKEEHYQGINPVTLSGYPLQTERNITRGLTLLP
jgi:hypothetical protein